MVSLGRLFYPFPSMAVLQYYGYLKKALRLSSVDRCLDVGVGTAHLACLLSRPVGEMVGFDISKEMVEFLERDGRVSTVKFVMADVSAPETRSNYKGYFTKAYSVGVLEHVDDPRAFLNGIAEVLSPHGTAIVEMANYHNHGQQFFESFDRLDNFRASLNDAGWQVRVVNEKNIHRAYRVYDFARNLYVRLKRIGPVTRSHGANVFHETSFYKSMGRTSVARRFLSAGLFLAANLPIRMVSFYEGKVDVRDKPIIFVLEDKVPLDGSPGNCST